MNATETNRRRAINEINVALALIDDSLALYPGDDTFTRIRTSILHIKETIDNHWPLPRDFEYADFLASWAMRNLDDVYPALYSAISDLATYISLGRKSRIGPPASQS